MGCNGFSQLIGVGIEGAPRKVCISSVVIESSSKSLLTRLRNIAVVGEAAEFVLH